MKSMSMLLALTLISIISEGQTCIVGIKTKEGIYVAADSRMTSVFPRPGKKNDTLYFNNACKIKNLGEFNIAMSGFLTDAVPIKAKESYKKFNKLRLAVPFFQKLFSDTLRTILRKVPPIELKTLRFNNETIFFGYEQDTAIMIKSIILVETSGSTFKIKDSIETLPFILAGKRLDIYLAGKRLGIYKYLLDRDINLSQNTIEKLKLLIEVQSKETPKLVGGPIDIIFVSKKGFEWKQLKKECQ